MAKILRVAVALNARDGITGLLLSDGLHFLQALEGPDELVAACYRRIVADPQHFNIRVIFNTHIERREFGDWAMKQRTLDRDQPRKFETEIADLVTKVSDLDLRAFFIGFAALGDGRPSAITTKGV